MTSGKLPGVISDDEATKCIDYIANNCEELAELESKRKYLEKFRSSKRSILRIEFRDDNQRKSKVTDGQCEDYARAHPDYIELLEGWKIVMERELKLKYMIEVAQIKLETYRTLSANQRRATQ